MATQLSVHNVTRISARAPVEFLPQKRGEEGFWSRTLLIWQGSEIVEVLVFGATEAALMLPGEKPAEARLDAYAAQARKPYTSPTLTEYTLPQTDGEVDLAAESNPRFKIGDKVTPIQRKMYIGVIATVEEVSPDGDYLRFTEGSRLFPASLFRLAEPDNAADALRPKPLY